jgi:hypothetical protein
MGCTPAALVEETICSVLAPEQDADAPQSNIAVDLSQPPSNEPEHPVSDDHSGLPSSLSDGDCWDIADDPIPLSDEVTVGCSCEEDLGEPRSSQIRTFDVSRKD